MLTYDRPMELNDLLEIEAIKRVKYTYLRCLDQKLWDEMREVFTDDAVAGYSGGKYSYEGRDAIIDFLVRSMGAETFHSSHRVHHPEIDLTSDSTAVGTWAMDDVVVMTDWNLTVRGAAFYEDEIRFRQAMRYPPAVALINAVVRGRSAGAALQDAGEIVRALRWGGEPYRVLGPAPAPLSRIKGEHRAQFFIKGTHRGAMREALLTALATRPEISRRTPTRIL